MKLRVQDEPCFIGIVKNAVVVEDDGHSRIVQVVGTVL
jgi:hypothetical protein